MEQFIAKWIEFENEIICKNRFFCNHSILNNIKELINSNRIQIKTKTRLYRARIIPYKDIGNDGRKLIPNYELIEDVALRCEALDNTRIWGYNNENSGAPPYNIVKNGRTNPKYISYLYVTMHPYTALAECKPYQFDNVNIATYETKKEILVADISIYLNKCSTELTFEEWICNRLNYEFSHPVRDNDKEYIITQFISEYIKHLGFDGICFESSLHKHGKNITLYDTNICNFIKSEVYSINDIVFKVKAKSPFWADDITKEEFIKKEILPLTYDGTIYGICDDAIIVTQNGLTRHNGTVYELKKGKIKLLSNNDSI